MPPDIEDRLRASSFGRPILLTALTVLAALTGPGAWGAAAAAGGVHFDPSSPAGQEYALPLERAREEAAGTQGQVGSKGESAALFGAGVSGGGPRNGSTVGAGGSTESGSSTTEAGSGSPQGGTARAHSTGRTAHTNIALATTGGGFSLTAGVAIVAAILLAAAVAGLVLRRLPSAAAP